MQVLLIAFSANGFNLTAVKLTYIMIMTDELYIFSLKANLYFKLVILE